MMLSLASQLSTGYVAPAVPLAQQSRAAVSMDFTKEELGTALNPAIGYFDPLGLATADFWGQGNDATWGWLRHSEIKHGRIAMFAFLGYCVQYNGIHCAFPLSLPEETNLQYAEGLTPPEQWDALTFEAKAQIFVFIAFLEFWGEFGGQHYMRGGQPGKYPEFPEKNLIPATPLGTPSLFDPLNFSKKRTDEAKAKGLLAEINNGRMAMIGIFAFLCEQKIPGSVPFGPHLKEYAGEFMKPF